MVPHELWQGWFEFGDFIVIAGSYTPDGTDPLFDQSTGYFTAVRDDVGEHTITLTNGRILKEVIFFDATLRVPAVGGDADNDAKPGPVDLAANTFAVFTVDTTDGAAVDLADTFRISFLIIARKSD